MTDKLNDILQGMLRQVKSVILIFMYLDRARSWWVEKFMIIWHLHNHVYLLFLRIFGNIAFLGGENADNSDKTECAAQKLGLSLPPYLLTEFAFQ